MTGFSSKCVSCSETRIVGLEEASRSIAPRCDRCFAPMGTIYAIHFPSMDADPAIMAQWEELLDKRRIKKGRRAGLVDVDNFWRIAAKEANP